MPPAILPRVLVTTTASPRSASDSRRPNVRRRLECHSTTRGMVDSTAAFLGSIDSRHTMTGLGSAEESPSPSPPIRVWRSDEYLPAPSPAQQEQPSRKQALIILNQPITRHDTLARLWASSGSTGSA